VIQARLRAGARSSPGWQGPHFGPFAYDPRYNSRFAISKLGWIKQQQEKLRGQERETPREYLDRESHFVWGKRYLLKVIECDETPSIELKHSRMFLRLRSGTPGNKKQVVVEAWYRKQIREAVPPLIAKWEPVIGVKVEKFFVQKMKTKWGSCNSASKSIRLNEVDPVCATAGAAS
jgi:predicted metal-dependent hydrolase